jgi:signal transduction histidine kinase
MRASDAMTPSESRQTAVPQAFDAFSVLDALGDAIAVAGPDWTVRYLNASWERILAVSRADALGTDMWATYPDLGTEPGGSMIRATAADGSTRRFDAELSIGQGGEHRGYGVRVARTRGGCVVIAVSRAYQMQKSARDRTLEERNEENAALRALARQTAEVEDTQTLLTILCEAASAQCGGQGATLISVDESEGELVAAVGMLLPARGKRFPLVGSLAREVVDNAHPAMIEDFSASERPLAKRLDDLVIGPLIVAPLIAHDRVLGVLAVSRDRRSVPFSTRDAQRLAVVADHAALAFWKSQLLEQAQEADRAKGRFLATMSHELRTPLTALAGYEELLVDAVLGPLSDQQREVLERMHHVTQHLTSMIEEVLAYTNLETGGEVVRPTDFLAADLLMAAAAIVQPLAEQKGLTIITESDATPIRMSTDVDKARQILVNLAGNAVKFTEHGEVRMAVRFADGQVRFEVSDTGIGIASEGLQRLFRPFTQLDSGLTRKHGGTGLGLYISDRIARLLRGRIEVESRLGAGSRFTLVLPRE